MAFLVMLHGIDPLEAVKQLDAMYSLHLFDEKPDAADMRRRREQAQADRDALATFEAWFSRAGNTVAVYLRMLDAWKRNFTPATLDDPWDERYCEALQNIDHWDHLFNEYLLGKGVRMEWFRADGEKEERWHRDEQHAFELKVEFYKIFGKEVEALEKRIDAIRESHPA